MNLYSIKDSKTNVFARPFVEANDHAAMRVTRLEVNRSAENNLMYHYPQDFALYHVGTFSDVTGEMHSPDKTHNEPRLLVECETLVAKDRIESEPIRSRA